MTGRMKYPAFQFYPGDWQQDPGVRASSLQARGLWVEMLCLMHHGEPYGHLTISGKAINERTLSRLVGSEMKRVCASLKELASNGVYSLTKDGIIYSRRMVKDAYLRAVRAKAGSAGGKVTSQFLLKQMPKQNGEQSDPPSSSSAEDVKGLKPKPLGSRTAVKHLPPARAKEGIETASLTRESQHRENGADSGPPEPIIEFREWVKDRVPNWVMSKASKVWKDPDDRKALDDIFRVRALFEIQACWQLFTRAGSKAYDYAIRQRFSMREFKRQIEHLVNDPDYPGLKRRFMVGELAEIPA